MRKILILFSLLLIPLPSLAQNIFFGDNKHQVAFNFGWGFDQGFLIPPPTKPVPFSEFHLQYSIPATFFGLPARQSLNITQTVGFGKANGWEWDEYSIPIGYLSEDIAILWGKRWYFGAGAGLGFQVKENERIGSKLVFQFKVFAAYKITQNTTIEAFAHHFSNGNTAPENNSYAFWGLGYVYSF